MAKVKKISADEFYYDLIKKEFELVGAQFIFENLLEFGEWSKKPENKDWYNRYRLTPEQYTQWKNYFYAHIYDFLPKRTCKTRINSAFSWINLQIGFLVDRGGDKIYD